MQDTLSSLIHLSPNTNSIVPRAIVESKLSVTPNQMDILAILLAEIGKDTDIDENLEYSITAQEYAKLKGFDSPTVAYKILKDKVCGVSNKANSSMRHIGFEIWLGGNTFEQYNWFSKIRYDNGIVTLTLTPQIKEFLVEFKHSDTYKVFAKLKYILPMRSQYSKRIYLMCREFVSTGERFCDTDWKLFLEKLGIPDTYRYAHIKDQILNKAQQEINECSDININFTITEEKVKGGKRPTSIKFTITQKPKVINTLDDWE